jgi:hypothetical protein
MLLLAVDKKEMALLFHSGGRRRSALILPVERLVKENAQLRRLQVINTVIILNVAKKM